MGKKKKKRLPADGVVESKRFAIFVDLTRCTGCRACQVACEEWHEDRLTEEHSKDVPLLPWSERTRLGEETSFAGSLENPTSLSPRTMCFIHFMEPEGIAEAHGGKVEMRFQRVSCMHCREATCITVCPSEGCIVHDKSSGYLVVMHPELCVGCMYCVTTCPFQVPQFDPVTKKAYKCNGCYKRVQKSMLPLCVKACPSGALSFGRRTKHTAQVPSMSDELDKRFNLARDRGMTAVRYGRTPKELGGLGVMYLLEDKAHTYYNLPPSPRTPGVVSAWRGLWQNLAWIFAAAMVVFMFIHFIIFGQLGTRIKVDEEEEVAMPTDEELERQFKAKRSEADAMRLGGPRKVKRRKKIGKVKGKGAKSQRARRR